MCIGTQDRWLKATACFIKHAFLLLFFQSLFLKFDSSLIQSALSFVFDLNTELNWPNKKKKRENFLQFCFIHHYWTFHMPTIQVISTITFWLSAFFVWWWHESASWYDTLSTNRGNATQLLYKEYVSFFNNNSTLPRGGEETLSD